MSNSGIRPHLNKEQKQALNNLEQAYASQQEKEKQRHRQYNITKATSAAISDIAHSKSPMTALTRALYTGVKLASQSKHPFYDELISPLALVPELKKLGTSALVWSPETLCAAIDSKIGGWTNDRISQALEKFHTTGELETDVPELVRQKLYSLRIVITSDSAHSFWEVFEKVGCAFNDRLANFSVVQALSASECARTLAIIQNVRPDTYAREVKIYIAACCHQDGLYTTAPSKWLGAFNQELQEFNEGTVGSREDPAVVSQIRAVLEAYKKVVPTTVQDSTESIQAVKLLGIDQYAEDVLKG